VHSFLVTKHLHRPLETFTANIAIDRLECEVRASDVITQRAGIAEMRRTDMANVGVIGDGRLLENRLAQVGRNLSA
jgi:hypothetical protein